MTTATKPRLKVTEAFTRQQGPLAVDEGAGVIRGVRVLGFDSTNKRRYTPEGVQKAVRGGLYNGCKVYVDHPQNPNKPGPRPSRDLFGKLQNAQLRDDGVYADLHYLTKHPLAESVVEDCKRGLGLYGLSHNAIAGDYRFDSGVQVVTEIAAVESVDLVSDPATNTNLWEGRAPVKTTLKRYLEARTLDPQLPLASRGFILRLCEMQGELMEDMPMDEPAPDAAAAPDGYSLLHQAIAALAAAGDEKSHTLATKLLKLVKPDGEADTPDVEEGDMGYDDDEDDKKPKEGKKKPVVGNDAVLTEGMARDLCESMGQKATAALVEGVTGLPLDKALKMLKVIREAQPPAGTTTRPPRTQETQRVTEAKRTAARLEKLPSSPAALRKWSRNAGSN